MRALQNPFNAFWTWSRVMNLFWGVPTVKWSAALLVTPDKSWSNLRKDLLGLQFLRISVHHGREVCQEENLSPWHWELAAACIYGGGQGGDSCPCNGKQLTPLKTCLLWPTSDLKTSPAKSSTGFKRVSEVGTECSKHEPWIRDISDSAKQDHPYRAIIFIKSISGNSKYFRPLWPYSNAT